METVWTWTESTGSCASVRFPFTIRLPARDSHLFTIFWSVLAFIFLNSVPAHAEWRPISYAAGSGGFTIYVDPATVLRQGDLVKMLVLYDFKFVQAIKGKSYLSATWQQQFDCADQRSRHLSYKYHSDNMGNGKVMFAGDDEGSKWSLVAPKSAAAILWNIGCDKDRQPT